VAPSYLSIKRHRNVRRSVLFAFWFCSDICSLNNRKKSSKRVGYLPPLWKRGTILGNGWSWQRRTFSFSIRRYDSKRESKKVMSRGCSSFFFLFFSDKRSGRNSLGIGFFGPSTEPSLFSTAWSAGLLLHGKFLSAHSRMGPIAQKPDKAIWSNSFHNFFYFSCPRLSCFLQPNTSQVAEKEWQTLENK
jgi:hypothetical protein